MWHFENALYNNFETEAFKGIPVSLQLKICALASENQPYKYEVIIGIIDQKDKKRQILEKILLLAVLVM